MELLPVLPPACGQVLGGPARRPGSTPSLVGPPPQGEAPEQNVSSSCHIGLRELQRGPPCTRLEQADGGQTPAMQLRGGRPGRAGQPSARQHAAWALQAGGPRRLAGAGVMPAEPCCGRGLIGEAHAAPHTPAERRPCKAPPRCLPGSHSYLCKHLGFSNDSIGFRSCRASALGSGPQWGGQTRPPDLSGAGGDQLLL